MIYSQIIVNNDKCKYIFIPCAYAPNKINTDDSIQNKHIKQNITGAVQICRIYNDANVVYLVTGTNTCIHHLKSSMSLDYVYMY